MHHGTPNERADYLAERLLKALRGAMADKGVKFYATELGLGHATLLHKLEPDNPGDHLTLRQLLHLLVLVPQVGDVMRPVAEALQAQWLSLPTVDQVGADLHLLMTQAGKEFGDVAAALLQGADPDSPGGSAFTQGECDRLEREADEALAKLAPDRGRGPRKTACCRVETESWGAAMSDFERRVFEQHVLTHLETIRGQLRKIERKAPLLPPLPPPDRELELRRLRKYLDEHPEYRC